jgi:integrase
MRPIAPDEELAILAALTKPRDRLFFLFGRFSGFRASELLSIRVRDVWENGRFHGEITLARSRLKGGLAATARRVRSRSVPLYPDLKKSLEAYLDERFFGERYDPEAHLFPSRKGENKPITKGQAWRIIKGAARACCDSSRIGVHSLRKSFAQDVFMVSGHDLVMTQHALGHSSVLTTTSHLIPDREKVSCAILGIRAHTNARQGTTEVAEFQEASQSTAA